MAALAEDQARKDVAAAIEMALDGSAQVPFELISRTKACLAAAKLPAAREVLEDLEPSREDPVVAFTAHLPVLRELEALDDWVSISGDVTGPARHEVVRRFQAGEHAGIVVSIRAGGEGIDLTRASRALMVDREWSPAANDQAIARLDRIGQSGGREGSVSVVVLVADHALDARISELLAAKRREQSIAVDVAVTFGAVEDRRPSELERAAAEAAALVGNTRPEKASGKPRRMARDVRERWAAAALAQLTADDPDHAAERNNVGFNRNDGDFGRKLAAMAADGFTDGQWDAAIKLCQRYTRQVGRCPEEEMATT